MSRVVWRRLDSTSVYVSNYRGRDFVIGLIEHASRDKERIREMMDAAISEHPEKTHFKEAGSFFEPVSGHEWKEIVSSRPLASII